VRSFEMLMGSAFRIEPKAAQGASTRIWRSSGPSWSLVGYHVCLDASDKHFRKRASVRLSPSAPRRHRSEPWSTGMRPARAWAQWPVSPVAFSRRWRPAKQGRGAFWSVDERFGASIRWWSAITRFRALCPVADVEPAAPANAN